MDHEIDIPTAQTLSFVLENISSTPQRILDIGAGTGALAACIQRAGHRVVALDASEDAVAAAIARGVDARRCDWPDFSDEPFDVVVFNRSLHHMRDLAAALDRVHSLLKPEGRVLVEDFAFATVSEREVDWLDAVLSRLQRDGIAVSTPHPLVRTIVERRDVAGSVADHDAPIHSGDAMEAALRSTVGPTTVEHTPYLYRYVAASIEAPSNNGTVASVLAEEWTAAKNRQIALIGRRFVVRLPSA